MKDLIDREALLGQLADKMREHECYDTYTDGQYSGMDRTFSMIENAPAVDAMEVKHGRWMNNADDYPECNRCGYMPQYDPAIDDIYYSPYCPNCGARMDGE